MSVSADAAVICDLPHSHSQIESSACFHFICAKWDERCHNFDAIGPPLSCTSKILGSVTQREVFSC